MFRVLTVLMLISSFCVSTLAMGSNLYTDCYTYAETKGVDKSLNKMVDRLADEFNDICGDTFCEGDYSNLSPINFVCTVDKKTGEIKSCLWQFSGNEWLASGKNGPRHIFNCSFAPKMTLTDLITKINSSSAPLDEPLSGLDKSLWDVLDHCLAPQ